MSDLENEVEYEVDSLTADLAAAWDDAGDEEDDSGIHQPEDLASDTEEQTEAGISAESPDSGRSVDNDSVQAEVKPDNAHEANSESVGAPVGLSPTAKEAWKDTPKAMQAEITKRESDFARGIQQYAEGAKRAQGMDAALQPFQQYMAMNGGPGQTIKTLMETGSQLQMGSPVQKAQMVAQLISQFGVDIGQLDSLLVGQAPKEQAPDVAQQVQQMVAQQMAPFQQYQQQIVQQEQGQISQEVSSFGASHEFYNDVSGTMANALDLAASRGQNMTMEQAYEISCQMNPEINKILQARKAAPTESQRRAASSIHGGPAGDSNSAGTDSLRASIESAWDNAGRA